MKNAGTSSPEFSATEEATTRGHTAFGQSKVSTAVHSSRRTKSQIEQDLHAATGKRGQVKLVSGQVSLNNSLVDLGPNQSCERKSFHPPRTALHSQHIRLRSQAFDKTQSFFSPGMSQGSFRGENNTFYDQNFKQLPPLAQLRTLKMSRMSQRQSEDTTDIVSLKDKAQK
jgi:hypothetical protein